MKKILSLLVVALLFSCAGNETEKKEKNVNVVPEEVKYQIENYSTRYHLFNDNTKPSCNIHFSLPRLTSGIEEASADFVRKAIFASFFSDENGGKLLQERFKLESELLLGEYKELEKDFDDANEDIAASFNWTHELSADFFEIGKRYITIRVTKFQNTGGAHPNLKTFYTTIDLQNKRILTPDVVFDLTMKPKIISKILEKMKGNFDTPEEFEMNVWKENVRLTNNFYLKDSTLVMYYNSHEVGPQSMGPVELYFSMNELSDVLKK